MWYKIILKKIKFCFVFIIIRGIGTADFNDIDS